MAGQQASFFIPEGAQLPNMTFIMEGAEEGDFSAINLKFRRSDGKPFTKNAVIDDPGNAGLGVPLVFHFEWDPGDIIAGVHKADLLLYVGGEPLPLPDKRPIRVISRDAV